jgi:hypothetical protein
MDSIERQFVHLTQLVLDGIATDAERAELARLSAERPDLVTAVFDELIVDALLKWQSGSIIDELPPVESSVTSGHNPLMHKSRKTTLLWTGMIAATALIVIGLASWKFAGTNAADFVIADIVNQQGVNWSDDSTALGANDAVRRGRLTSFGGEYTLQFRGGATVRVSGQASLTVKSKMLVQLDHGQATANVPQGGIGFTITSALVDVVDQGTQFGISVDKGRADVIVFDGKVDVQSKVGNGGGHTRLTQGTCIQIDRLGAIVRVADVRRDVQGRWWTDDRESERHVIARVSDNIHSGNNPVEFACYQTTFEGLHEDAVAYSDNPNHQWNGLTADGLPDFLRGADYIKSFNDYRYLQHFEMKIGLAQPANLYVFFDDRVDTPDWLKENFEDTGVDIGLDEGPWLTQVEEKYRKLDVNTIAAGGGKSIDNIFSVWRRRCAEGGTVSLGNCGALGNDRIGFGGRGGRSMYGIAATPLEAENVADEALKVRDGG